MQSNEIEIQRIKRAHARRKEDLPKGRYSYFSAGYLFGIQEREREMLSILRGKGIAELHDRRILKVGCGTGYRLREFVRCGARPENVFGVDLLPSHVAIARHLCPQALTIQCGSATSLDFPTGEFDLVLQSLVFTSVLDGNMRQQIASEMLRVVKPDGFILWYDYHVNNPRNPDVRAVKGREIYELFPGCDIKLRRVTLFPYFARWFAPYSWLVCHLLSKIPLLRTHYLGVIQKKQIR